MKTDHPNFCIAPWTSLYVSTDGATSPCCHWNRLGSIGNVYRQSPNEIWNSPEMRNLRLDMLEGREIPNCEDCRRTESAGGKSLRQDFLRIHAQHLERIAETSMDGSIGEISLASLSMATGDRCQLRCKTCGPWASSAWQKELGEPESGFAVPSPEVSARIQSVIRGSERLQRILFSGGEPLISPFHYETLDLLLEQKREKQVELFYNSNLFQLRWTSKDALDYWKRFAKVTLYVSIDGVREKFEELRQGHDWKRLVANIREVRKTCPHVELYGFFTLSVFNLEDVPETIRTLLDEGLFSTDRILLNFAQAPEHLSARNASAGQKSEAKRKYLAFMKELLARYDAKEAAHLIHLLRACHLYFESP